MQPKRYREYDPEAQYGTTEYDPDAQSGVVDEEQIALLADVPWIRAARPYSDRAAIAMVERELGHSIKPEPEVCRPARPVLHLVSPGEWNTQPPNEQKCATPLRLVRDDSAEFRPTLIRGVVMLERAALIATPNVDVALYITRLRNALRRLVARNSISKCREDGGLFDDLGPRDTYRGKVSRGLTIEDDKQ